MPLVFETWSEACQRRLGRQRRIQWTCFPSPRPSSLGSRGTQTRFPNTLIPRRTIARPTWLPLPKGEGWGEGEGSNQPATTGENHNHTLWLGSEILVALGWKARAPITNPARFYTWRNAQGGLEELRDE